MHNPAQSKSDEKLNQFLGNIYPMVIQAHGWTAKISLREKKYEI